MWGVLVMVMYVSGFNRVGCVNDGDVECFMVG